MLGEGDDDRVYEVTLMMIVEDPLSLSNLI